MFHPHWRQQAPLDLDARLRQQHPFSAAVAAAMARRLRGAAWWAPRLAHRRPAWRHRLRGLARWVPRLARDGNELEPLMDGTDLTAAEVRVHLCFSAVVRLDDLLLRRVRVGLWQPALARQLAPRLRPLFEQELGWDHRRWEQESEAFDTALQSWSPEGVQ